MHTIQNTSINIKFIVLFLIINHEVELVASCWKIFSSNSRIEHTPPGNHPEPLSKRVSNYFNKCNQLTASERTGWL